jgi:hypothetical protein
LRAIADTLRFPVLLSRPPFARALLPRCCSLSATCAVDAPSVGDAFQLVLSSGLERQPAPSNKILDRLRGEDFGRAGQPGDAGSDDHGDASELLVDGLDLSGVSPARTSTPSGWTASTIAWAQRIALAGPSNDAKNPSPAVSISFPR